MDDRNRYLDSILSDNGFKTWDSYYIPVNVTAETFDASEALPRTLKRMLQQSTFVPLKPGIESFTQSVSPPGGRQPETFEALEGLRSYVAEHVLLIGKAGAGKTTVLQKLLLELAREALNDEHCKIPVFLELRHYESSFQDLIQKFARMHGWLIEQDEIENKLLTRGFCLLIDGLNELPSGTGNRDIEIFRETYGKSTRMIFSTRESGACAGLSTGKQFEILPLTQPQIRAFVTAYFSALGLEEKTESMLLPLQFWFPGLAEIPLFLTMLCAVFKETGVLPHNLGSVLRAFTANYQQIHRTGTPNTEQFRALWPELFQRLAFTMLSNPSPRSTLFAERVAAVRVIANHLAEARWDDAGRCAHNFLNDFVNHHLLQSGLNETIEFRHPIIQDYYAAEHLGKTLQAIEDDTFKQEYLNYVKWTDCLKMMMELLDDEKQVIRVVKLALEVDLVLAAKLAGSAKRAFHATTVKLIASLDVPDDSKCFLLRHTRSDEAIAVILCHLNSPDVQIRSEAVGVLAASRSKKALPHLINAFKDLGLLPAFFAETGVSLLPPDYVIPLLIDALKDQHWAVRFHAASTLGTLQAKTARPKLTEALQDENDLVCKTAARSLRQIATDEELRPIVIKFESALQHGEAPVRRRAAECLGQLGVRSSIRKLAEAIGDEQEAVQCAAIHALGLLNATSARFHLIGALKDRKPGVRGMAAETLGNLQEKSAIPYLIKALEEGCVRGAAAKALGRLQAHSAGPLLMEMLQDPDPMVKYIAATALGEMKIEAALPDLLETLGDNEALVRKTAIQALGEMGAIAPVEPIIEALRDKDSEVRSFAAKALGRIKAHSAIHELTNALRDGSHSVRYGAAMGLAQIDPMVAHEALRRALADQGQLCSYLEALNDMGDKKVFYGDPPAENGIRTKEEGEFRILHLSDLHFTGPEAVQNHFNRLRSDLKGGDLNCSTIDALIISGDIADKCCSDGYAAALEFIRKAIAELNIPKEGVLLTPGNHDLDRTISENAYKSVRRDKAEREYKGCTTWEEYPGSQFVYVPDTEEMATRFRSFQNLYKEVIGEDYSCTYKDQWQIVDFPDSRMLILGLNSAWNTDDRFPDRAEINMEALSEALETIHNKYGDWIKIAVWHHPLVSEDDSQIKKHDFMDQLAQNGFRIVLHGHLHKPKGQEYRGPWNRQNRGIEVVGAGTFGGRPEDLSFAYPWEYNFIVMNKKEVKVYPRVRYSVDGIWQSFGAQADEDRQENLKIFYDFPMQC